MTAKLTQKQENFCLKYIECGNASEAYRFAYNAGKMKMETINRSAKENMENPKISARIAELQAEIKEEFSISFEQKLKWLQEVVVRNLAEETPSSVTVSAINEINKMVGDHAAIKTESKHTIEQMSDDDIISAITSITDEISSITQTTPTTH